MSAEEALSAAETASSAAVDQTQNQLLPAPPPKIESELKLTTSTLSSLITPFFVHPQGIEVKKDQERENNRYQIEQNDEDFVVGVRKQGAEHNKDKGKLISNDLQVMIVPYWTIFCRIFQ